MMKPFLDIYVVTQYESTKRNVRKKLPGFLVKRTVGTLLSFILMKPKCHYSPFIIQMGHTARWKHVITRRLETKTRQ